MQRNLSLYAKIFNPALIGKVLYTFDKATMVVVSATWGAILLLILFALYTVNLSVEAKRQMLESAAMEPDLPRILTRRPEASEIRPLLERLQKRFPEIGFSLANDLTLTVTASDGAYFRTWLTVLSYIDTISPQYRWQIKEFCVGTQCRGSVPMQAFLTAQKITFSAPKTGN